MTQKLAIGQVTKGLNTTLEPWNIDNDAFPTLTNAYQWRGKAKRKRGTEPLTRLSRFLQAVSSPNGGFQVQSIGTDDGLGNFSGNLITRFSLGANSTFIPGSFTLSDGINTYTDNGMGILTGVPGGSGTINYASGDITITGGAANAVLLGSFKYYPGLPVLDIEDLVLAQQIFPGNLAFDTTYSYNIQTSTPYTAYDVSFYKNPPSGMINGATYTAKTNPTPLTWNSQTYQQYWSVNYENAMWVTNQFTVPFNTTNIGMQFAGPAASSSTQKVTFVSIATSMTGVTTLTVTITNNVLSQGDWVFLNEWTGTNASTLNFQSGFVTSPVTATGGTDTVIIILPFANSGAGPYTPGIIQFLTNRCNPLKDCLRWYDGDPTGGNITTFSGGLGWVNFCPPLSQALFPTGGATLGDLPPAQYYLVGAALIWPFKDRILFLGAVIQSSTSGPFYLQDTVVYSQNGTPYYTSSWDGTKSIVAANTQFYPLLVPGTDAYAISTTNIPTTQTSAPNAYFEDVAGFGGNITAGFQQPITSVGPNQDVLIVGFPTRQTKIVYTGDDLLPFLFYIINSELGTINAFSTIVLDRGVLSIGQRGIIQTDQVSAARIDLEILNQVFNFNLTNNGAQRITAQRDYVNEWVYFTYTSNEFTSSFPNQTLFYNYRDQSWGIFNETYTAYGQFRGQDLDPWNALTYLTWNSWTDPWLTGTVLDPIVAAGNQQGFIVLRDVDTTAEAPSLYIKEISGDNFTVPNHCLNPDDYIYITGALGTVGPNINWSSATSPPTVYAVIVVDANTIQLNPPPDTTGTYLGGGLITRMYKPEIFSKEFPMAWGMGRKTRIGPQRYLFTTTPTAQISLEIQLSTSQVPSNQGNVVPGDDPYNNAVVYSQVLYTCIESTNLGLTSANINLQQIVPNQLATWHRMNTSLIGDTVQFGFTLSDLQMRDQSLVNQFAEIEFHGAVLDVSPSQMLA